MRTAGAPFPWLRHPPADPEGQACRSVTLDPELIKAKMAETEQAASLLAGIFTGEPTSSFIALTTAAAPQDTPSPQAASPVPPGLDAAHRSFLARLAERPSWPRSEVARIAAELGLMPDGALEIVNEAAFELRRRSGGRGQRPG